MPRFYFSLRTLIIVMLLGGPVLAGAWLHLRWFDLVALFSAALVGIGLHRAGVDVVSVVMVLTIAALAFFFIFGGDL